MDLALVLWFGFTLLALALSASLSFLPGSQGLLAIACFLLALVVEPKRIPQHLAVLSLLFVLGILLTLTTSLINGLELSNEKILRLRYWVFQFFYAYSGVVFVKKIVVTGQQKRLLLVIKAIVIIFSIIACLQVIVLGYSQATILSSEPSQASGVLLYWLVFFIVLSDIKYKNVSFGVVFLAIVAMAAIGSKAIFISVGLLLGSLIFRLNFKEILVLVASGFVIMLLQFDITSPYQKISYLYEVLSENGLAGLSYNFLIWDSWIVRIGSMLSAGWIILDYPVGIGFGSFDQIFPNYVERILPDTSSNELIRILSNESYATPKSYLLEFVVSIGLLGLMYLVWMLVQVVKIYRWSNVTVSFVVLMLQATLVELAPYLAMILMVFTIMRLEAKCRAQF